MLNKPKVFILMIKQTLAVLFALLVLSGCSDHKQSTKSVQEHTVEKELVSISSNVLGKDFDLEAAGALYAECQSLEEFEQKLNEPNGVNNVDFDEDGEVDLLTLSSEVDGDSRIIAINANLKSTGEQQNVANLFIERRIEQETSTETYEVGIVGNQDVYGHGAAYTASYPSHTGEILETMLYMHMFNTMFSPSYSPYHSPYGFGSGGWNQPSYYSSRQQVTINNYQNNVKNVKTRSKTAPKTTRNSNYRPTTTKRPKASSAKATKSPSLNKQRKVNSKPPQRRTYAKPSAKKNSKRITPTTRKKSIKPSSRSRSRSTRSRSRGRRR